MTDLIWMLEGKEYHVGDAVPLPCLKCGNTQTVTANGLSCGACGNGCLPDLSALPFTPDTSILDASTVQDDSQCAKEEHSTEDITKGTASLKEGLDESQVDAFGGVMKWVDNNDQTLKIGGFAGTGKSHLTSRIARWFQLTDVSVAFAAPTGKAALVLKDYLADLGLTGFNVSTVHGLIYQPIVEPSSGRVLGWERRQELPYKIIVIDEASMLSETMLNDVLSFGRKVLMIGDNGQLPPVGDDCNPLDNGDHMLTHIHRQARGNPIIHLSKVVRDGSSYERIKKFVRLRGKDKVSLGSIEDAVDFTKNDNGMIVTFTNNLRTSINNIVRWERFQLTDEDDPQVGEAVICLKNLRLECGVLIPNGMRGVIESVRSSNKHYYTMTISFGSAIGSLEIQCSKYQFLRNKTFKGFDEVPGKHSSWYSVGALFDFGYAMTAHKVQGSQSDRVAVVLETYMLDNCMTTSDRTRWIYTAVTRSTDKLMLVFK